MVELELGGRGFTPVLDVWIPEVGPVTALVYGRVWRYCQMKDKVCYASLETLGEQLGMGVNTVRRHIRKLCKLGWLEDTTPDKRDGPHVYRDVGASAIIA